MTSHTMLQAHFGFNQAMNRRLWTIIMEHLTDAQFAQETPYSRGSIRSQLVHMADAQHYWLRGLLNIPDLPQLNARDYPTRAAARAICQQSDQQCLNVVSSLSDIDLQRVPDQWSQPVWVGLLQLAHHGTDHRAQILRALYDLGAPTFEQNFAVYMENATPMSVADLLAHVTTRRAEWDGRLQQLPAAQMDRPLLNNWTVRDAVAILTWQEQQVTAAIHNRAVDESGFQQLPGAEQARILAAGRALPLPALLDQHQSVHRQMLDALRALDDADLNAQHVVGLPPDERFWKAIAWATWWSYPDFIGPLQQLLAES